MQVNPLKIFAVIAVIILMICGNAFAGSQTTAPVLKYTDTTSPLAVVVNDFHLTEVGNDGFKSAGYFRLVIPSSVALQRVEQTPITRDTTTLGSKSSPRSLYIEPAGQNRSYIFVNGVNGSNYRILEMGFAGAGGSMNDAVYNKNGKVSTTVKISEWDNPSSVIKVVDTTAGQTSTKIGEIYYNDTTQETIITLAGLTDPNNSEELWLQYLTLKSVTAGATGSVNVSMLDGQSDINGKAVNGLGITDDTDIKVLEMTDQPVYVATPDNSIPPTIPIGKVAGQASSEIDMHFAKSAEKNNNKITITLDNGAKFHAGSESILKSSIDITNENYGKTGTTAWNDWQNVHNSSLIVDPSGALVISLGTADGTTADEIADTAQLVIHGTNDVIDTYGVIAPGDIKATVVGSGDDLIGLNASVKIASAALTGTSVKFFDGGSSTSSTAPETGQPDIIYAGRTKQTISDYLLIGEDAPGSLIEGGTVQINLNLGAKFSANSSIAANLYTIAPYSGSSALTFPKFLVAPNPVSSICKIVVSKHSTTNRGAYRFGDAAGANPFSFDLSNATPGALKMTVSGNAGVSGTVTMATIINATTTSVLNKAILVPGTSAVALPDIVITENHYGALGTGAVAGKDIVIHFPTPIALDQTANITITSVGKTDGASSNTAVTMESVGPQDLYLDVAKASTFYSGPYTITIKGIVADISSNIGPGSASFMITGINNIAYGGSGVNLGSDEGAKPTAQNVAFGSVVSNNTPFAGTPVVKGTMVTQTFIPAGKDINKTGDVYIFAKLGQNYKYYTGSAWSSTEAPYDSGVTLDKMLINYDVDGLPTNSKIYIGYGVGITGTSATMNSNATFVLAYTTPSSVSTGTSPGDTKVSFNVKDNIDIYLNITNDDGIDPSKIKQEWLVFGENIGGISTGFYFYDGTNVVPYTQGMDLSKVTYKFDHSKNSFKVTTINLDSLGLKPGDTFWYGYVYSENGIDLSDPATYSLENVVTITAK